MADWSLVSSTTIVAVACEFLALARLRAALEARWDELQALQALNGISTAVLQNLQNRHALERVLPMIAALGRAVTGYLGIGERSKRASVAVAVPGAHVDRADRAAAALLAATSLSMEDASELSRAVSSRVVQQGENMRLLLESGESALPAATRSALLSQVELRPYLVVPVIGAERVFGLLLVALRGGAGDPRALAVCRAAARLGFLLEAEPRRERRPPARRAARGGLARGEAEIVLWLSPDGTVVSHEALQPGWSLEPLPRNLAEVIGQPAAQGVLSRARASGQTAAEVVLLPASGELAEIRVVPIADVDGGLWGYAVLLARLAIHSPASGQPHRCAR